MPWFQLLSVLVSVKLFPVIVMFCSRHSLELVHVLLGLPPALQEEKSAHDANNERCTAANAYARRRARAESPRRLICRASGRYDSG